ncbi:MAG: hypothetical protein V4545_01890 [Pseudomonadota bacterium]
MSAELKFLNDVAKPWDELNALLIKRYAFQPDLSSVTQKVSAIAAAIRHQIDIFAPHQSRNERKKLESEINAESDAVRLVTDVCDSIKHVRLTNLERENHLYVAAMFEVDTSEYFSFIRNGVFVEHATLGCKDFMQTSLDAIRYWVKKRELAIQWSGSINEANVEFFSTAYLSFHPEYCIRMESLRIKCFQRNDMGSLEAYSPSEVKLVIY